MKTCKLSKRQTEILILVAAGKVNKEIADALGISPKTVDVHRKILTLKTGARGAAEFSAR